MKFLVEIEDIEAMKREICEGEGEEYYEHITDSDYIALVDSCLNMFNLGADVELLESEEG